VRLSVTGAHVSRVASRHVGRRSAPRPGDVAGPTSTDAVLRHDSERVIGPGRQRHAEVARVAADVRARRAPHGRIPRRVVLDDELTNGREILAEQRPVQLDHASVADRPMNVHRGIGNVFKHVSKRPVTNVNVNLYSALSHSASNALGAPSTCTAETDAS